MTRRIPTLSLAALLLAILVAGEAFAHGGNFRVGNPDPQGPAGGPLPPRIPIAGPVTPNGGLAQRPAPWLPNALVRITPYDWPVWWALNHDTLLPARQPARSLRIGPITPSGMGRNLPHDFLARLRWRKRLDVGTERIAVPFFLELLAEDRAGRNELTGVALIALARTARDSIAVPYLRRYAFERKADREVRECAVIGMGLTRRTRKGDQLRLHTLDTMRHDLMRIFDDEKAHTQLRAFALYSLALLADQAYGDGARERYGRDITRWLHSRLRKRYAEEDLPLALLTTLGHQPKEGIPTCIHDGLKDLVLRRYAFRQRWSPMGAAQAVQVLARLQAPEAVHVASTVLRGRRPAEMVQCAACLALALRAGSLSPSARAEIAEDLRKAMVRLRRGRVHRIGLLALGTLLDEDLRSGSEVVLTQSRAADVLRHELKHGSTRDRPYAALGLGLAARRVEPTSRPSLAFAVEARRALIRALERAKGADLDVASYAAAVGLARAEEARPLLLEILRDHKRHHQLRGHCAIALAELGHRDKEVATALLDASRERLHPWLHNQAVRALAILGIPGTAEDLLEQFAANKTRGALVAVAASLGQLGDPKAADRMVRMAKDCQACRSLRVASVVGLGLLFDREEKPSRTRLTEQAAYMALSGTLARFIDVR